MCVCVCVCVFNLGDHLGGDISQTASRQAGEFDEAMAIVVEAMGLVAMFRNYCTEAVGGCDERNAAALKLRWLL